MNSKYLSNDPIPWLLDESDPIIKYLTLRDILKDGSCNEEYSALENYIRSKKIIKIGKDQILGDKKKFDIFYSGSMWYFAHAVEIGLDKRSNFIEKTANFIIDRCQMKNGEFTLNWKPECGDAARTGDMLKYLINAGFMNDNIENGIQWIVNNQRHDGGWLYSPVGSISDMLKLMLLKKSGNGLKREKDFKIASCPFATIACSMALISYIENDGSFPVHNNIRKAAEFLLNSGLYKFRNYKASKFLMLGYPLLSQYDVLYGLLFIAKTDFFSDSRAGLAFNHIMSKQNNDGTWNFENIGTGMMLEKNKKIIPGKKNKWVTLNVLRMLKYIDVN